VCVCVCVCVKGVRLKAAGLSAPAYAAPPPVVRLKPAGLSP
jgi:hypothetical protein